MDRSSHKKYQSLVVLAIFAFFSIDLYDDVVANGFLAYGTWNQSFYSLDTETGIGTKIPCSVTHLHLAFAPDGTLYATSRSTESLYRFIDPSAGTLEYLAHLPIDCTGGDITVSPDGEAIYFTLGWKSPDLFKYDIDTGNLESLGPITGTDDDVYGLAFSPEGVLYGTTSKNTGDKILYMIDISSLEATAVGPPLFGLSIDLGSTAGPLDFAPDGTLYAGIDPTSYSGVPEDPDLYLSTIDPQAGLGTIHYDKRLIVDGSYYSLDSLAITPEPATLILFGFGGLALLRKRRL